MNALSAAHDVRLDVQEVGPRVWRVTERQPGAPAVAGVIAVGGRTVVFDTLESVEAGVVLRELAASIAPVELVVNSHGHRDHVSGNPAFAGVPIAASAATRRTATACPPTLTFEGSLIVHGDVRTVDLLAVGRAHTHGDVVAYVRDCGVLFAGDLAVWTIHPRLHDGDPHRWLATLERLSALGPSCVVCGHGPACGPDVLAHVASYIDRLLAGTLSRLPGCPDLRAHEASRELSALPS